MKFIDNLSNDLASLTNMPKNWCTTIVISILSSVVDNLKIDLNEGINLNIWGIGIGRSRIGKTRPQKLVKQHILSKIGNLFPNSTSSPEGLYRHIDENKAGIIVQDEATTLLNAKNYREGMLELLNQLYDGWLDGRETIRHGYQKGGEVYVSFLASTTENMFSLLGQNFFTQGLAYRFIYEMIEPKPLSIKPSDYEKLKRINIAHKFQNYQDWLKLLRNDKKPKSFRIQKNAQNLLTNYYNRKHLKSINFDESNLLAPYYNELPIIAFKLAGLYSVSRSFDHWKKSKHNKHTMTKTYTITEKDARSAINKANYYLKMFEKFVHKFNNHNSKSNQLEEIRLISIIKELGKKDGYFSQKEVSRQLGVKQDYKLKKAITELIVKNILEELSLNDKKKLSDTIQRRHDINRSNAKVYRLLIKSPITTQNKTTNVSITLNHTKKEDK